MKNRGVSAQLNSSNSSVTQPVGQDRSERRVRQIEVLHKEFHDLKKKIKDIESRNEDIIQNIHKRHNFKKKQLPRTTQYMQSKSPIVHYDGQEKVNISADNQSNNSNESECEFKIAKHPVKKTSSIKKNFVPGHHQSVQYGKTQQVQDQLQPSEVDSSKANPNPPRKPQTPPQPFAYGSSSHFRPMASIAQDPFQLSQYSGLPQYQMSMQFPPYPSMADSFYGTSNNFQYQESIRREKEKVKILQKQLEEKQADTISLKRLQKKINSLSLSFGQVIDGALQEFYQEVMKKGFYEIEKHIRKNQNKLRKLHLMVKDKEEESRSIKNISQHRLKRSISRTKKDNSPRNNNSYSSVPRGPNRKNTTGQQSSSHNLIVQNSSASKSKQQSDISRSSLKFEQIAGQYEQMIKQKNKVLQISQQRFKQKQNQLAQMASKFEKLQLKLAQFQQMSPRKRSLKQNSDREQNLLSSFQAEVEKEAQIKMLSKRVSQIEQNSKKKQQEIKQKENNLQKLNKKLNQFQIKTKKLQNELGLYKQEKRKYEDQKSRQAELQIKIKRFQSQLMSKDHEYGLTKEKYFKIQSQKIQTDCENVSLTNRLKKVEALLIVKEQKIEELQKIIQSNSGLDIPDLLQKSMTFEKLDQNQIQILQQERQKLEEALNKKNDQLFKVNKNKETIQSKLRQEVKRNEELKREVQTLLIQNESMRLNMKALEFEKYSVKSARLDQTSPLQKLLQENQCLSQHEDNNMREQLQQIRNKYEEAQRIIKAQNHSSLDFNTKIIKINSQLSYYRELLTERQNKYEKLKKQFEEGRCQINQLTQTLHKKEAQLQEEKRIFNQKIMQLEAQMLDLQQQKFGNNRSQILDSNNISQLRNSRNFSEESFVGYRNTFNSINAQNQLLTQKLKEAQKMLEIQKEMEKKIMDEYRANVDKIKVELREKSKENQHLLQQLQISLRKIKHLEQLEQKMKQISKTQDQEQLLGMSNERITQLQSEINELKEINTKMADVEEELLKQLAQKEKDNQSLTRLINTKERKIQQLQDIIELKEMNFSSHISSSQHKSQKIKDSQQSQCSLRYSIISNNFNKDKTMELQLSEAGQSFYENNQSMISNVSQVFGREEFPYEKMQLRRVEQRRLFQKTAAYIKTLKHAIEQKNKRIKLLQKKIESLRNSELIRKDIYQIKENLDFYPDDEDIFKDYYSVQLQTSHSHRYKLKQLEHETKLTIEENNLLNNQIESLQEELLKSEQQEASLMKLKDLYKDEIKTLIKKNQQQAKVFEDEMKKERTKVEQSESVQRMQALKQLFLKIVSLVALIQSQGHKSKKKDERKKQLQEYIKVFCNFINLQESVRDKLLSDIRK